ncbi:hypothetical protein HMPREF9005_1172 [Actinomyces sp. oral taxon 178 str. F0338]|nr:hypothetical protein HMPREF9005_1172 [Actinomyces sp. oral taxon 178 str. F0338]
MRGSSPRVRGKLDGGRPVLRGDRLIPARAGKTTVPGTVPKRKRAHPRACGENRRTMRARLASYGSSPRVRGKPAVAERPHGAPGLIPARAGKTPAFFFYEGQGGAHPRACGENDPKKTNEADFEGSSPRVRGKHAHGRIDSVPPRLIPARAGKTSSATSTSTT